MLRRTFALPTIAFGLSMLAATDAAATAQRTFVASNGNDANPCSLSQPCRGFGHAITQTSSGGEVIVLDSAGYGIVTITKSVSIIAPAGIYGGISVFSGQNGVTVNAPSAIVVLRGLSINGQGGDRGIFLQAAARVRIENCVISGMGVAGISHTAAGAEMIVFDTTVRDNGGSGIVVFGDLPSAVLDHVRSEHNGGDGFNFGPTSGSIGALATVFDSVFTHNEGKGIGAASVPGGTITLVVERSVMASNGQDGFAAAASGGSGVVTLSRNTINDNGNNGIWLLAGVSAVVSENVVHRNSGSGVFADLDPSTKVHFSANVAHDNLGSGEDVACGGIGDMRVYFYQNNLLTRGQTCSYHLAPLL